MPSRESIGQYVQIPDLPVSGTLNGSEWIEIVQQQAGVLKSYRVTLEALKVIGQDGLSAYEVAQKNGFEGTVQAWLNSLIGKSAYDIVRELHPEVNTEQKFVEFITGPSGKSAYELAKAINPQIGSEAEWIDSLYGDRGPQGERGDNGAKGDRGDKGDNGAPGVDGVTGPQGERGPQGVQGERGQQGTVGNTGIQGPKGDKGDPGNPGAPGTPGTQGTTGDPGTPGTPGLKGDKGDKGDKGEKGDPGSGGGGEGGFLYWEEDLRLGAFTGSSHSRNGRASLTLAANVIAIEKKLWAGEPHKFIDLYFSTTEGGSVSFQEEFEPKLNDVNISRVILSNESGDNGYGMFLGGGGNLVDIQTRMSGVSQEDDPTIYAEDEALYGSTIIGGVNNTIEGTNSSIAHGIQCYLSGYDNNGDGDYARQSFIGYSYDSRMQGIQSMFLGCDKVSGYKDVASGFIRKTNVFGSTNTIVEASKSFIGNDEYSELSGSNITSFSGENNSIDKSDFITMLGARDVEALFQKNIVVIGGYGKALLSGSPTGAASLPYELNTVIENATYSSQKRRVIGRMKYGQETATPLVYIPHGKTFKRGGDILTSHPSIFRVKVEMYLFVVPNSHNETMVDDRQYCAYELSYTAVKFTEVLGSGDGATEETKLKPLEGSMRVIDLKTGDFVNDGYSPFYLREIDEYGDTDWLGADFNRINGVMSQPDDTEWTVSYVADITEIHHANDSRGAAQQVPV